MDVLMIRLWIGRQTTSGNRCKLNCGDQPCDGEYVCKRLHCAANDVQHNLQSSSHHLDVIPVWDLWKRCVRLGLIPECS